MWRSLWDAADLKICVIGSTPQFRFVVKCVVGAEPKISIFEGGHWRTSTSLELTYYMKSVDEWSAVVHHHQGRGWVTTTARMFRLNVLRN